MIIRTKRIAHRIFSIFAIITCHYIYHCEIHAMGLSPSCQSLLFVFVHLAAAQAIADQIFAGLLLPQLLILVPATA